MRVEVSEHAKERMREYGIQEDIVRDALNNPDSIAEGYGGRKIYQKKLNYYILRVIIEKNKDIKKVITVYKARSGRYEV